MTNDTIIIKHGKEYDEEAEFLNKYPIAICPECISSDTYIVRPNSPDAPLFKDYVTGDYRYHKKGIFIRKQVNVNYRCNSCRCAFRKWYDVNERKPRVVSGKYCAIIITGLIFVFSIVSAICAEEAEEGVLLSNGGYYTNGFMIWMISSIFVAIVSLIVFAALLWSEV